MGLPLLCADLLWPFTLPSLTHACLYTHTSQGFFLWLHPLHNLQHTLFSSGSISSQHNLIPLHHTEMNEMEQAWNKIIWSHIFLVSFGPFPILFLFNFSGRGLTIILSFYSVQHNKGLWLSLHTTMVAMRNSNKNLANQLLQMYQFFSNLTNFDWPKKSKFLTWANLILSYRMRYTFGDERI